jgi:chloramphenicol O-acetyltransferase type A
MRILNKNTWNRKEHFDFFNEFDEPYFGLVACVDCSKAYAIAKENGYSFFAYYLYCSMITVNNIPEFKYRNHGDEIIIHDVISASPTIGRDDGTFGFGFIPFNDDFSTFRNYVREEVNRVKKTTGIGINENTTRTDVVHYSSLPWMNFTGLTHPRNFKFPDSVPKITFGKVKKEENGSLSLPVSVNVHHGFCDGLHVSRYLELFQSSLNKNY